MGVASYLLSESPSSKKYSLSDATRDIRNSHPTIEVTDPYLDKMYLTLVWEVVIVSGNIGKFDLFGSHKLTTTTMMLIQYVFKNKHATHT